MDRDRGRVFASGSGARLRQMHRPAGDWQPACRPSACQQRLAKNGFFSNLLESPAAARPEARGV